MASGWNLWVWLQCIGVASGCCCKEVYRLVSRAIRVFNGWQRPRIWRRV